MVPFPLVVSLALVAPAPQAETVAPLLERSEAARRAGRLDQAIRILDEGAPAATPAAALRLRLQRARCVYYRSSLAGASQDAVVQDLRAILREAESRSDSRLLADVRDQLGLALYGQGFRKGDLAEPRALFEQALAERRHANDARGMAESLFHVALTFENRKDPTPEDKARARALHRESLAIAEAGGFDVEVSYAVRHLAGHQQDAGDLDGALAGFERSLALREKAGYAIYYAPALLAVGDVWKEKGDPAKARHFFERAKAEADRLGAARFQQMADEALKSLDAPPTPRP